MVDVAAAAGVSRGTVSRVLNGGRDVSGAARRAVEKAMQDVGYVANPHARALAANRSGSVAFVLASTRERLFEDPNVTVLLDDCTRAFAAHGISTLVMFAGGQPEGAGDGGPWDGGQWGSGYLHPGRVDGMLVVSIRSGSPAIEEMLASGLPTVGCGKPIGYRDMKAYVTVDDREGARQMVEYLRSTGRRRIATITGPLDTPGGLDRLAGYRETVDRPDPDLIVHGDFTRAAGERAMEQLLAQAPDLDAVFVASDLMAAGALAALRRAGRRVPDDVAVGSFDDSHLASSANLNLTTMRQPWRRISTEMVRLLVGLVEGDSPSAVILPTELVVRASA